MMQLIGLPFQICYPCWQMIVVNCLCIKTTFSISNKGIYLVRPKAKICDERDQNPFLIISLLQKRVYLVLLWAIKLASLSVRLGWAEFFSLSPLSTYFCYYLWVSLHFLILFIGPTVLFNLFFNNFFTLSIKSFKF